jgi:hypothetical protein
MNRAIPLAFALAFVGASVEAPAAHAAWLRARAQAEKVNSLVEEISEHQGKRRNDKQEDRLRNEPRYYRSVFELYDACKVEVAELSGFGESISADAYGELETALKEPNKLGRELQYQLEKVLMPKTEELRQLINSDPSRRDSDFESKLETAATFVITFGRRRFEDFVALTKKSEEVLRLLRDNLKEAQAKRDDAARPGTDLFKSKRELETAITQNQQDMRRAYETIRDLDSRHTDAANRCRDAVAAHDAARTAAPGSSYTQNVTQAFQRWAAAENVQKEAARALFDAYQQMERIVADGKARLVDLAKVMRDVERYGDQYNAEKMARRYNDLERWSRLFDYELNR